MENVELRKVIVRAEYKERIDGLRAQYSQEEIDAATAGASNAYASAVLALTAERDQVLADLGA